MKIKMFGLILLGVLVVWSCGEGGGGDDSPTVKDDCQNNPVVAIVASQTDANVGQANGSATIEATGGFGGYTYSIDGGPFQTSPTFVGLEAGNHTVVIKSSRGCETTLPIRIVESANNLPSYASDIQPIIATRCATAGCHVPGTSAPFALQSYEQVKANAEAIKARTTAKTMPPSGSPPLTDTQIMLIADWVDGGAPNN